MLVRATYLCTGGRYAQAYGFATYHLWQQLGAEAHKATYLPREGGGGGYKPRTLRPNDMIAAGIFVPAGSGTS